MELNAPAMFRKMIIDQTIPIRMARMATPAYMARNMLNFSKKGVRLQTEQMDVPLQRKKNLFTVMAEVSIVGKKSRSARVMPIKETDAEEES